MTIRTPAGEVAPRPSPPRPLQRLQRARRGRGRASSSGATEERIPAALASARSAFGRVETIEIAGKRASILLIKNPAGANEVLRTLRLEADGGLDLWIGLNDRIADGRDVSWIWDADFELLAGSVRRVTCAGTRAPEMALRLKYAGWPQDSIVVEPEIERSLDAARGRRPRAALRPPHLHRAARAAPPPLLPRPDRGVLEMSAERASVHLCFFAPRAKREYL